MTWKRALEADARLAAKNSVLFRAALRQSIDFEAAFRGYQATTPNENLTLPQQRARARSWAIINIRVNLESFKEVLLRTWAQAWVLGDLAAGEQLELARKAQKADTTPVIDWSKWKPGDAAAALILKPPKAFQRLLEQQSISFKGFTETTLRDLGNSIGEAIELGLDSRKASKLIMNHVASPARALTIAITEQNRAISEATKNRYAQAGVQRMEWLVFDPCPECAKNEGVTVTINQPFPSGDTQPPAHPNCRCALAPVIPGLDDVDVAPGATITTPPVPIAVTEPVQQIVESVISAETVLPSAFVPGKWKELSREEITKRTKDKLYETYGRVGYSPEEIDNLILRSKSLKADRSLIEKGAVYVNGKIEVQFHSGGASVPKARQKEIVAWVNELQKTNPKSDVTVIIGPTKRGAYGWATLNGDKVWLAPKTAKNGLPNKVEGGSYKMPALLDNPQWKYTLTHEWGHHIDDGSAFYGQSIERTNAIARLKEQFKDAPDAFISGYGKEKFAEFIAEMFAEWFLTKGQTINPLVRAVAKEFGWKS